MIAHYLKIALRNIFKDRIYSLINLVGLSVAIACCFLLIFWIRFELSFEDCHPKAGRIYQVLEVVKRADGLFHKAYISSEISHQLKESFPEIEESALVWYNQSPRAYEDGEGIMMNRIAATRGFLDMFSYDFIEGSKENVLKSNGVILSEEVARKFFGNESAVGKTIHYAFEWSLENIQGVVKIPQNTHMRFDLLQLDTPIPNGRAFHYILVRENIRFSEDTQRRMADFLSTTRDTENKYSFLPLKDVHLHSPKELAINFISETQQPVWHIYGDLKQIYLFSLFALLVLTIAVINYVNTSIARSLSRMREVGVRKMTGSTQWQLILRFLSEAFILSAASMVVAMAISKFLFPEFSMIMGNQTPYLMDFNAILISLAFCIVITILSGGYAAFYLSSFDPVTVLRGGRIGSKENMRKILTGFQFFLSVGMLISAWMIYQQINYMFIADTGVDRKNIIIIDSDRFNNSEDFFQVIKRENPNIIDATYATGAPYNIQYRYNGVSWTGSPEEVKEIEICQVFCDSHYANVFGLQVVDGDFFQPRLFLGWDGRIESRSMNIVINESFRKLMGVDNPIGITVDYSNGDFIGLHPYGFSGKIIGVVKDFNFKPMKEPVTPLIFCYYPSTRNNKVYIKTTGNNQKETLDYIREKYLEMSWPSQRANRPFILQTVEDEFNAMYKTELRTLKILTIFSILSLFLCTMGIFSMVSFMVERRKKEIAIRRINGAETMDIISLFIMDFIKIIVVACVIAIPVSFFVLLRWIQTYAFQTSLRWWIFVLVPVVVSLVTAALIAVQVFFTTRQNPAAVIKVD